MLEPNNRQALLEALRPPEGYTLDFAVGTTYSLDLPALLMVPLAFTFFDIANAEEGPANDPVALLEAVRRNAGKIAIFVQAGQIKVPVKRNQTLYAELETCVHQVQPANENAILHAKLWVLRFKQDKEVVYRLLCSSRNLTFDRSWDTLLVTEGPLTDRQRPYSNFSALGDFIKELSKLSPRGVPEALEKQLQRVQREVRYTDFEAPAGFKSMSFWALGPEGYGGFPIDETPKRLLAISPFLDNTFLPKLIEEAKESILISRQEELRRLNTKTLKKFSRIFFLNSEAETKETAESTTEEELEGLHTKLYIAEYGWQTWVITGSANATEAGFNRNFEFQVALEGKTTEVGIDAFLADEKNQVKFYNMLSEFCLDVEPPERDKEQESLEREADKLSRVIASLALKAVVKPSTGSDLFDLTLVLPEDAGLPKSSRWSASCWPITLAQEQSRPFEARPNFAAEFPTISFEALTTFFGFEVKVAKDDRSVFRRFVVNVPAKGFPENRSERLLRTLIKGADDLLRLILLILSENASWEEKLAALACLHGEGWRRVGFEGNGLLESLVRSLASQPWKLDHINRILTQLEKSGSASNVILPGFEAIWRPVWEARKALKDE